MPRHSKQPPRGNGGRFCGARVNCEDVPCMPAGAVSRVLNDPRRLPYLMVWRNESSGGIGEAVRVAAYSEPPDPFGLSWDGWVEIKRPNGTHTLVRTIQKPMPRNRGSALLLICPFCHKPKRALYGQELDPRRARATFVSKWQCRTCAGLRYASEGGALVIRSRWAPMREFEREYGREHRDRPEPWYPYVFSNPEDAQALGVQIGLKEQPGSP